MNYISAEQFLEQPDGVQKALRDWWKPEMYDLFFRNFGNNPHNYLHGIYEGCIQDNEVLNNAIKDKTFLPLLSETQLRHFIEDNTGIPIGTAQIRIIELDYDHFNIVLDSWNVFTSDTNNLLQAYWQVACKIVKEKLKA